MSPAQTKLYWREWKRVWRVLQARSSELTWRDSTQQRHDLHRKALGYHKSSKALTNGELDKVLGELRAVSQPDSIRPQERAQNQPRTRRMWVIGRKLLPALGKLVEDPEAYLERLLQDRWKTVDLADLTTDDLSQLIMTLNQRIERLSGTRA